MLSLEWLAAGLGLAGVLLGLRENIWVWPFFIASSAIYLLIYLKLNLIGQAVLMLVFILTSAWGLWNWRKNRAAGNRQVLDRPFWLQRTQRIHSGARRGHCRPRRRRPGHRRNHWRERRCQRRRCRD
ncbi:MAG: nicotinamide mononucleotide transporter, partial [Bordetella sp.]